MPSNCAATYDDDIGVMADGDVAVEVQPAKVITVRATTSKWFKWSLVLKSNRQTRDDLESADCVVQEKSPSDFSLGLANESPAATYSPTHLRGQYHRR